MRTLHCKTLLVLAGAALVLLSSCSTARSRSYLLDMEYDTPYVAPKAPELRIQQEDRLNIVVLSETPQLAAPFNTLYGVLDDQHNTQQRTVTYTVNNRGDIDFPALGTLHVEGMTIRELTYFIQDEIKSRGYIKDPVVNVSLENFKVTVIGEMANHVITVTDPSINILQVVAQSGGANKEGGNIRDLTVIRTEEGQQKAYKVDLQSRNLFQSPVYYLQQNDIVYLKPKGSGLNSSGETAMTFVGTGLSIASIITNFLLWSRR